MNSSMTNKMLINRRTLLKMIPLSDRTIYNLEQRGEFPKRIVLTSRSVAWDLAEICFKGSKTRFFLVSASHHDD